MLLQLVLDLIGAKNFINLNQYMRIKKRNDLKPPQILTYPFLHDCVLIRHIWHKRGGMEVCLFTWVLKNKKRCILGFLQVAFYIVIPHGILLWIPHGGTCITLWLLLRDPWKRAIVSYSETVETYSKTLNFHGDFNRVYTVYATNELSVHLYYRMSVQYTIVAITK